MPIELRMMHRMLDLDSFWLERPMLDRMLMMRMMHRMLPMLDSQLDVVAEETTSAAEQQPTLDSPLDVVAEETTSTAGQQITHKRCRISV